MSIHPSTVRWLARLSMIAALVCFTGNCLATHNLSQSRQANGGDTAQPAATHSDTADAISRVVSMVTSGIILAGIGCGIASIVLGGRIGDRDSQLIGTIGLLLNLGIIAIAVWALWQLRL